MGVLNEKRCKENILIYIMFRQHNILKPIIRRLFHNNKIICRNKANYENNKIIGKLLRQQNKYLKSDVTDSLDAMSICILCVTAAICFHK